MRPVGMCVSTTHNKNMKIEIGERVGAETVARRGDQGRARPPDHAPRAP